MHEGGKNRFWDNGVDAVIKSLRYAARQCHQQKDHAVLILALTPVLNDRTWCADPDGLLKTEDIILSLLNCCGNSPTILLPLTSLLAQLA